jgi:small subunit ribosomal protein S10
MINSIEISLRSFEYSLLKNATLQIKTICSKEYSILQVSLPIKQKRFTVLRSPHIDKKSREQFEIKYHKAILNLTLSKANNQRKVVFFNDLTISSNEAQRLNESNIEFLIENLKRVKFTGVQVKIRVKYSSFLERSFLN